MTFQSCHTNYRLSTCELVLCKRINHCDFSHDFQVSVTSSSMQFLNTIRKSYKVIRNMFLFTSWLRPLPGWGALPVDPPSAPNLVFPPQVGDNWANTNGHWILIHMIALSFSTGGILLLASFKHKVVPLTSVSRSGQRPAVGSRAISVLWMRMILDHPILVETPHQWKVQSCWPI